MTEGNNKGSLFEIRLNSEGAASVIRFVKTAKWVFGIMLLAAVINITQSIILISLFNGRYFSGNRFLFFQQKIHPVLTITYFLLAIIQSWYYWQTAKKLSQSLRDSNEHQFNQAFHLLHRHAILAVITLTVGLIMIAFQFFVFIQSYYHIWA